MSELLVDEIKKIARREAERVVRVLLPKTVDGKLSGISKRLCLAEKIIHSSSENRNQELPKRNTGAEMTAFRIQHGLSQRELASLLKCHWTSICRWEKGRFRPNTKTAKLFAELQSLSHDEIAVKRNGLAAGKNT